MMDDLISRQAAIDAICKACANGDDFTECRDRELKTSWCDNMVALRDLPSAQPEQRWIPVSERLPEEGQQILATVTDNAMVDVFIIRGYFNKMHKSVIAWMPLPEPYAERRTDDE